MTVIVLHNQTLFDISVRYFGTADAALEIAMLNGIEDTTEKIEAGTELEVMDRNYGRQDMIKYFEIKGMQPATALLKEADDVYEPETAALMNYCDANGITPANIAEIDTLISEMKVAGIWQKLDVFYVFAGYGGADFKMINLINPSAHPALAHGGLTWSGSGVKGDGLTGWIDTNFNPAISGINYTLNDASIFAVLYADATSSPLSFTGKESNSYDRLTTYVGTIGAINASNNPLNATINISGNGFKSVSRISSTALEFITKSTSISRNANSTIISNSPQSLFKTVSSNYCNAEISCFGMGAALTYPETQTFRTIYNQFLTLIGQTAIA